MSHGTAGCMTPQGPSTGHGPVTALEIEDLQRVLETLARDGKWSELSALMKRRDALLAKVADSDRASVFGAAVRSNDQVQKLVQANRQAVAHQLTSLRRGRQATRRYESHRVAENMLLDS